MSSDRNTRGDIGDTIFPKRDRRAVVLCDGPRPPLAVLARWLDGAELFVCTDGAGRPYDSLPRPPDLVIGDFDTLGDPRPAPVGGPRFIRVREQESSDSEKALLHMIREGTVKEVALLGSTGARLDHSLFNVHLLERFAERLRLCIADEHAVTLRISPGEEVSWDLPEGTLFSLLPLGGPAKGVELSGAFYPLRTGRIAAGGPATISNRVAGSPLAIRVSSGALLVSVALPPAAPGAGDAS